MEGVHMKREDKNPYKNVWLIVGGTFYFSALLICIVIILFQREFWYKALTNLSTLGIGALTLAFCFFLWKLFGIGKASDESMRLGGRYLPKILDDAIKVAIIVLSGGIGLTFATIGIPEEIAEKILVELENAGIIQQLNSFAPIVLILLIGGPLIYLYYRIKNPQGGTISTSPQTTRKINNRKKRRKKDIERKLGRK